MSTREIVTLQLGHFSSHVGSHWWNVQEASFIYDNTRLRESPTVNHDVLFREGSNLLGDVTYTPRLVVVDLHGSLSTLKRDGTLYDTHQEEDVKWVSDVTLHESISVPKNAFLRDLEKEEMSVEIDNSPELPENTEKEENEKPHQSRTISDRETPGDSSSSEVYSLDSDVNVWSDYLATHLHPKSIVLVESYRHQSDLEPFDLYNYGVDVFKSSQAGVELEDRVRFYTEECDRLQGFHVLADFHNGFGGLASSLLTLLDEEFPRKACLTFGCHPAHFPDNDWQMSGTRLINAALSCEQMACQSSLFIPLSLATGLWSRTGTPVTFPHLSYKANLNYHSSSILASCLDTCSMPYRLSSPLADLADITNSFSSLGRKVSTLSLAMPFQLNERGTFAESLMSLKDMLPWRSIVPHTSACASPWMQSVVIRGIPSNQVKSSKLHPSNPLSQCMSADDVLKLYLTDMFSSTVNAGCAVPESLHVALPFPNIFTENVNKYGQLSPDKRSSEQAVQSIPVMTSLQCSPDAGHMITSLHDNASKLKLRRFHRFAEAGLEEDEFKECMNNLQTLKECYSAS